MSSTTQTPPIETKQMLRGSRKYAWSQQCVALMSLGMVIMYVSTSARDDFYIYAAGAWVCIFAVWQLGAIETWRRRVVWDETGVRQYSMTRSFDLPWNRMSRAYFVVLQDRWDMPNNLRCYRLIDEAGRCRQIYAEDPGNRFRAYLENLLRERHLPAMREGFERGETLDFDGLTLQKQIGLTMRGGFHDGQRLRREDMASYHIEKNRLRLLDASGAELARIHVKRVANLPALLALLDEMQGEQA